METENVGASHERGVIIKNIAFGLSGGWLLAIYFTAAAILYALTIVGVKKAYALCKCASFCLLPYGRNVYTDFMSHKLGNILWACTIGWQAALLSMLFACIWYATILGAYLGNRYVHLAQYAVAPFGAKCYPVALLTGGDEGAAARVRAEHNFEL